MKQKFKVGQIVTLQKQRHTIIAHRLIDGDSVYMLEDILGAWWQEYQLKPVKPSGKKKGSSTTSRKEEDPG